MRATLLACVGVAACAEPPRPDTPVPRSYDTADATDGSDYTYSDTEIYGCDSLPPSPRPPPELIDIETEEDFDFDAYGYLVHQDNTNLVGHRQNGDFRLIAANVATDPSAVQVLSDGYIVVAAQDQGALLLVDPSDGSSELLIGGLAQPNGVEIGSDDRIYFSEAVATGRVRWVDRDGTSGTILPLTFVPNGLVLSPDEQTLYVGGHSHWSTGAILAVKRLGPDEWENTATVLFGQVGHEFTAVEVDICGNIYGVDYDTGELYRGTPDGTSVELVADVDDPDGGYSYSSIRWGNGVSGWRRDHLYITNRRHIFSLDIAIDGKPNPTR